MAFVAYIRAKKRGNVCEDARGRCLGKTRLIVFRRWGRCKACWSWMRNMLISMSTSFLGSTSGSPTDTYAGVGFGGETCASGDEE